MGKKLYVGNIPWTTSEEDLKNLFAPIGPVTSAKIITDKETGKSRGFAFVEMENADKAIAQLNNTDFGGRALTVNEARERESRPSSGGYNSAPRGGGYERQPRGYDNRR